MIKFRALLPVPEAKIAILLFIVAAIFRFSTPKKFHLEEFYPKNLHKTNKSVQFLINSVGNIFFVCRKYIPLHYKNKKVNLSLPDAAENLTENEVKDAMNEMCEANLFVKEEVDQYQTPLSAQYVERTVTSVFDDSEKN